VPLGATAPSASLPPSLIRITKRTTAAYLRLAESWKAKSAGKSGMHDALEYGNVGMPAIPIA